MQKLIIISTFVACCLAAPTAVDEEMIPLNRPTPINPEIPSDPKPTEKITVITDPVEITKYKHESGQKGNAPAASEKPLGNDDTAAQDSHYQPITSGSKPTPSNRRQKREDRSHSEAAVPTPIIPKDDKKPFVPALHAASTQKLVPPQIPESPVPAGDPEKSLLIEQEQTVSSHISTTTMQTPQGHFPLNHALKEQQNRQIALEHGDHLYNKRSTKSDMPVPPDSKQNHEQEGITYQKGETKTKQQQHEGIHPQNIPAETIGSEIVSSTTENFIRPHPVPVAELFARPK